VPVDEDVVWDAICNLEKRGEVGRVDAVFREIASMTGSGVDFGAHDVRVALDELVSEGLVRRLAVGDWRFGDEEPVEAPETRWVYVVVGDE
jgi:hypothetical protein